MIIAHTSTATVEKYSRRSARVARALPLDFASICLKFTVNIV